MGRVISVIAFVTFDRIIYVWLVYLFDLAIGVRYCIGFPCCQDM
jgi:hypothetical protein